MGEKLSERTIRRYLNKKGIRSYAAVSKPYLFRKHITMRLNWAKMHNARTLQQWNKVAFSEEALFTVKPK